MTLTPLGACPQANQNLFFFFAGLVLFLSVCSALLGLALLLFCGCFCAMLVFFCLRSANKLALRNGIFVTRTVGTQYSTSNPPLLTTYRLAALASSFCCRRRWNRFFGFFRFFLGTGRASDVVGTTKFNSMALNNLEIHTNGRWPVPRLKKKKYVF